MTDFTQRLLLAPGEALRDAALGPAVSHSAPLFGGFYEGSPTFSDAAALPLQSLQPPQQQQRSQPQQQLLQVSSKHTLPLATNNSSFSFSFCGSEAFGVNDLVDNDPVSLSPPGVPSINNNNKSNTSSNTSAPANVLAASTSASGGQTSAVTPNPATLSAATLEYLYDFPTMSAAQCAPHVSSSGSNCSSNHHSQLQQQYDHPSSTSGDSNHSISSPSHHSVDPGVVYRQPSNPTSVLVPPHIMNPTSANSGMAAGGVQKDVLAFMAAEQQQQKFVLQQRNVYMSGLPVDFRPSAFRAMCEVFGRIESSKLCMEADDGNRCRGFGFVLFYDVDSANSCIASLNGKLMQGKTLQVRRADLSAAPQPLNPVTQRNRTGSGLVTPPTLASMSNNNNSANQNGTSVAATAYQMFSPPQPGPNSVNPHPTASSVVMSALPFRFATPTMMGPGPVSANNINNGNIVSQKGSATGSSFLYGGPSASSSLGNSNTPTMVFPPNATVVPAMRSGMPIMQVFAPCPPPGLANVVSSQQQQQAAGVASHPSMSRSDLTTTPHTATPSSAGSSNMSLGFATAPQLVTQQQQQQQPQMSFQPQPPMLPLNQPQRPIASTANMAFYSPIDPSGAAMTPAGMPTVGAGVNHLPNTSNCNGNQNTNNSMYMPNVLMQEYLTAAGLDPNASNPNFYYLFPQ